MQNQCSLNCGRFHGMDAKAMTKGKTYLEKIFSVVEYDKKTATLAVCGARGVAHDPATLMAIFDNLSKLLGPKGKGQIMLTCDSPEICYFRRNMWKLMAVHVPEDPFEGMHHVG